MESAINVMWSKGRSLKRDVNHGNAFIKPCQQALLFVFLGCFFFVQNLQNDIPKLKNCP